MQSILEKLNKLQSDSSTSNKVTMLNSFLDDESFRMIVEMALDETLHYNIKKLPKTKEVINGSFDEIIDCLYNLSEKQGATQIEKQRLANLCINDTWREVILRVLNKDLRCG